MSDCCSRERKKKDYLGIPKAILFTLTFFATLLFIEIQLFGL
jgi:hypothetical protein